MVSRYIYIYTCIYIVVHIPICRIIEPVFLLSVVIFYFFPVKARDAESRGDLADAQNKGRIALILNIVALVWWVIATIIIIAAIAGSVARSSSSSYCYYDSTYGYYCDK